MNQQRRIVPTNEQIAARDAAEVEFILAKATTEAYKKAVDAANAFGAPNADEMLRGFENSIAKQKEAWLKYLEALREVA